MPGVRRPVMDPQEAEFHAAEVVAKRGLNGRGVASGRTSLSRRKKAGTRCGAAASSDHLGAPSLPGAGAGSPGAELCSARRLHGDQFAPHSFILSLGYVGVCCSVPPDDVWMRLHGKVGLSLPFGVPQNDGIIEGLLLTPTLPCEGRVFGISAIDELSDSDSRCRLIRRERRRADSCRARQRLEEYI